MSISFESALLSEQKKQVYHCWFCAVELSNEKSILIADARNDYMHCCYSCAAKANELMLKEARIVLALTGRR